MTPELEAQLFTTLGKIDANTTATAALLEKHINEDRTVEARVRVLENTENRKRGAARAITALSSFVGAVSGLLVGWWSAHK